MSHHFPYEVGDEYVGPPALASKFISEIQAVGGVFEIDGDTVRIVYLPASVHGKEEVLETYKDEAPEAIPVPVPIPEIEVEKDDDSVNVSVDGDLLPDVEVSVSTEDVPAEVEIEVEAPKPSRRGRPKKTVEE